MEDEREYRRCLKIHGYVYSSEDANDSDDSKRKLDDLYIKCKPSPIEINPDRHQIIIIGNAEGNALENGNSPGHPLDESSQKSVVAVKTTKRKNKILESVPNLLVSNRFSALAVETTTEDELENGSLVDKEETLIENRGIATNVSAPIGEDKGVLVDNSKRKNNVLELEAVPNLLVSNRFSVLAVEDTIEDEMGNASLDKGETLNENQKIFTNVSGTYTISEDTGVLADNELTDEDEIGLFVTVERKFKRRNARHTAPKVQSRRKRV